MGNQLCKGATDEIDEHTRSAPSEASPTKMPETLDRPSSGSSAARNSGGVRKSGGSLNKSGEPTGRTGSPNKSAWARRRVWHGEGQGSLRRMPKVHEKSSADRHAVKEAVLGCTVLGALPDRQLDALIDCGLLERRERAGPGDVGDGHRERGRRRTTLVFKNFICSN